MKPSSELHWRKSSFTGSEGNCVEVASWSRGFAVRDSKDPAGSALTFSTGAWRGLIAARR